MNVALIGYGEVGKILGEDLRAGGHDVTAYDLKLGSEAGVPIRAHALVHGVTLADSHASAVRGAALVISAVTASQTVAAAEACAGALGPGPSSWTSTPPRRPRRFADAPTPSRACTGSRVRHSRRMSAN